MGPTLSGSSLHHCLLLQQHNIYLGIGETKSVALYGAHTDCLIEKILPEVTPVSPHGSDSVSDTD